jgi:hypothetical protein
MDVAASSVDLDEALGEEAADPAGQTLSLAQDHGVGSELGSDLGEDLLECAASVSARAGFGSGQIVLSAHEPAIR